MAQTTLSIRIDEDIKRRFDVFCADAGMNRCRAFNKAPGGFPHCV